MILWTMFICVHSFSVSGKKKRKKVKKWSQEPVCGGVLGRRWWGGGGGGRVGGTPTKKRMITDFYFLDLEFSEFRVDSSKHNTEPLPISWILWLIFIRFQDSKKIQCQSHDHMKFLMCYLLSGLKKTARNSQNAIKESPPKASPTQKIIFCRRASPTEPPTRGPTRGPRRPPWPLTQFEPPPPSTLRSGSGPAIHVLLKMTDVMVTSE